MNFKKISLLTIIIFAAFLSVIGQTNDIQRVIGPSPNVASLFKFVDQPISLYTGTVKIEIPIFTLKVGTIELPVS